jgi:hypothetical protein
MSDTWQQIKEQIKQGKIRISAHGYDELAADNILVRDAVATVDEAVIVEDYPDYHKGPCVLVRQKDNARDPIHVLWGIPLNKTTPAVLITAYRPDPERWSEDFTRRKT